jgi:CRP-like cAMP-binding protein
MMAPDRPRNLLLRALPPDEWARIAPHVGIVDLPFEKVLARQDEPIDMIYFPTGGVASMTAEMADGKQVEVGTIGREGVVNYGVAFSYDHSTANVLIQIPGGDAEAIPPQVFKEEMARLGTLYRAVTRYVQAAHFLITRSVACNALHSIEERAARWLLLSHDRVGTDTFKLTHEYLAIMLGVRRPSATLTAGAFRAAGLIDYRRGAVTIVDRRGLEEMACECYRDANEIFIRLLGRESIGAAPTG